VFPGKFATEIHHKAGRERDLLNDNRDWLAVSAMGHRWIHDNPYQAYKLGFLKGEGYAIREHIEQGQKDE
jgi:hypothetical protein